MSSELLRRIAASRAGGRVERAHGITHLGSYSNATHSWGVAMLMYYLWPEDFPRLAIYCLDHDVPEAWVGDVPAPTMRYVPGLKETLGRYEREINTSLGLPAEQDLAQEDYVKLKACDRLELLLWACEQSMMGNRFVEETIKELVLFLENAELPDPARGLFKKILSDYKSPPRQSGVMRELAGGS